MDRIHDAWRSATALLLGKGSLVLLEGNDGLLSRSIVGCGDSVTSLEARKRHGRRELTVRSHMKKIENEYLPTLSKFSSRIPLFLVLKRIDIIS